MAPSAPLVFSGITAEQYTRLSAKARSAGIDLTGNTGTASKYGVEVTWNYRPEAQELTLQCLKTPFFMSAADVEARIQSLVTETRS